MPHSSSISSKSASQPPQNIQESLPLPSHSNLLKSLLTTPTQTMTFLSISLIKIFLILFLSSHIAIAGPVPELVGNDLSVVGREQTSSRSVAAGDFLLSGDEFLGRSGTC
jgi:hypothetical protein